MSSLNAEFKPLPVYINNRKVERFESLEDAQAAAQLRNGSEAIVARQDADTGKTFFILANVTHYDRSNMDPTDPVVAFSFDSDPKHYDKNQSEAFQYHNLDVLDADLNSMQDFFLSFSVDKADPFAQLPKQPTTQQRQRFDAAAKLMGFKDFKQMQYQFRNLPADKIDAILSKVSVSISTAKAKDSDGKFTPEDMLATATLTLATEIKAEINHMFTKEGFPAPLFSGDAPWNGTAVMAVFNGLSEIKSRNPEHFKAIAAAPGKDLAGKMKPFEFSRAPSPEIKGDDLINNLNTSMRIAHTCTSGCLTLHDAAVSSQTSDVLRDKIATQLSIIMRRDSFNPNAINPTYTAAELKDRGMQNIHFKGGSLDILGTHKAVYSQVAGPHLEKFGGNDRLLYAYNFVVKFRGLDLPSVRSDALPLLQPPLDDKKKSLILKALKTMNIEQIRSVGFMMEQMHATASLQNFLKETTPSGKALTGFVDSGFYGQQTTLVVKQFQLNMVLNMYKERIEDDKSLPEATKRDFIAYIDNQFEKLGQIKGNNDGEYAVQLEKAMRTILKDINTVMGFLREPSKVKLDPNKFNEISSDTRMALMNQEVKLSAATAESLQRDMGIANAMIDGKFTEKTAKHLVQSWFDVMDTGGGGVDMAEQLVVHELGHILQPQLGQQENLKVQENWNRIGLKQEEDSTSFSMGKTTGAGASGAATLRNDRSSVSDYGSSNKEEDFAECYRVYTYDPDRLMRRSLMKYLFVHALSQPSPLSKEQAKELSLKVLAKAREAGYSDEEIRLTMNRVLGLGDGSIQFTPEMRSKLTESYAPLLVGLNLLAVGETVQAKAKQIGGLFKSESVPTEKPPEKPLHHTYKLVSNQYAQFSQKNDSTFWQSLKVSHSAVELYGDMNKFEERFLNNGSAALPDMTSETLAAYDDMVRGLEALGLKKPQINAMILAQGKLRAAGYVVPFKDLPTFMGEKIWAQLPEAFKAMLQNPRTMDAIAKGGEFDASLHAFTETMTEVAKRSQASGGSYLTRTINDLFTAYLSSSSEAMSEADLESLYSDVQKLVTDHNNGSQVKATMPSFSDFKSKMNAFYAENKALLQAGREAEVIGRFQSFIKKTIIPNMWDRAKLADIEDFPAS